MPTPPIPPAADITVETSVDPPVPPVPAFEAPADPAAPMPTEYDAAGDVMIFRQ
jgi:hypothetical protein